LDSIAKTANTNVKIALAGVGKKNINAKRRKEVNKARENGKSRFKATAKMLSIKILGIMLGSVFILEIKSFLSFLLKMVLFAARSSG